MEGKGLLMLLAWAWLIILFIIVLGAALSLAIIILRRERYKLKTVLLYYFSILVGLFILWFMGVLLIFPQIRYFERILYCPLKYGEFGHDPFNPSSIIHSNFNQGLSNSKGPTQVYKIWNKGYWTKVVDLNKCEKDYENNLKHQRDVRLRTNIENPAVIGWSTTTAEYAFGKPFEIEKGEIERWIYYPWEEGVWSVSIYMKDGKIYNIKGN